MLPRYHYLAFFTLTGVNGTSYGQRFFDLGFEITSQEQVAMVREAIQKEIPKGMTVNITGFSFLKKIVPKTKKAVGYTRPAKLLHS